MGRVWETTRVLQCPDLQGRELPKSRELALCREGGLTGAEASLELRDTASLQGPHREEGWQSGIFPPSSPPLQSPAQSEWLNLIRSQRAVDVFPKVNLPGHTAEWRKVREDL